MKYNILQTPEFEEWFDEQTEKTQVIVSSRLGRLATEQHWGHVRKFLGMVELKWTSGLRVYTAIINRNTVVVLLGGNKNGQNKDIKKAKKLLKEIS